jgi:hypothetical protein
MKPPSRIFQLAIKELGKKKCTKKEKNATPIGYMRSRKGLGNKKLIPVFPAHVRDPGTQLLYKR